MKSKIIVCLILIIFLFSIASVSAIEDANETIVEDQDTISLNNDEEVYTNISSSIVEVNEPILAENDDVPLSGEENKTHFGYWAWSLDVPSINLTDLADHGVTDLILNYYAFHRYNESVVESLALDAQEHGIDLHIWAQIFYVGSWIRPVDKEGNYNYEYFNEKIAELEYYAGIKGVVGIHYDYLRFSGVEKFNNTAKQNPGGKEAITYFVKESTEALRKINPNLTLSAAIMPEIESLEDIYGVEYSEITKYLDVIIPMVYRGNFQQGPDWVVQTTQFFVENSSGSVVWTGLQAYTDDDYMDNVLPVAEMNRDINNSLNAGAKGAMIFKINCSKNLDFNNLTVDENQFTSFEYLNFKTSSSHHHLDLETDYTFNESTDTGFTDGANVYYDQLTIDGNNHTIDAKNQARFINIEGDDDVLTNIHFINALDGKNPVIYINGENARIVNCSFESDLNIFTSNFTKYYGGDKRFNVMVLDAESNPISDKDVNITINDVTYTKTTDENGFLSMGINLNPGAYEVATCVDNKTVYSTVTILSTIEGDDIIKVFRNGTQYYATFVDTHGNEMDNANVTFNINGVMYTRVTDDDGIAKLNINLQQGEYIITAINPLNGEMHSNNITVLPSVAENADLTKFYKNDSQYVVRLVGADGNPVGAGEVVTFNINGVFYNRTTNESGYAKLNINLRPGDYIVTATYNGCSVSNNITVLTTLESSDMSMKYKDGSAFGAKVLDGQGKPLANQNVEFNINGVLYTRTTGEDGIAKLNINLMAGEYIITSSYDGYGVGNKVTISS